MRLGGNSGNSRADDLVRTRQTTDPTWPQCCLADFEASRLPGPALAAARLPAWACRGNTPGPRYETPASNLAASVRAESCSPDAGESLRACSSPIDVRFEHQPGMAWWRHAHRGCDKCRIEPCRLEAAPLSQREPFRLRDLVIGFDVGRLGADVLTTVSVMRSPARIDMRIDNAHISKSWRGMPPT